jgi:oligopeptide/dipeptide ABC transporter ATP-binding protein
MTAADPQNEISDREPLLQITDLSVAFPTDDGIVLAVDHVSYTIGEGETLGIVGESGSGKSVTSLAILGLLPKQAYIEGSVKFRGRELVGLTNKEMQAIRGFRISMIFQDALTSLNPVFRVGDQIAEIITAHAKVDKAELQQRVIDLLELVGIPNATERANQYPHEFSGGMRQRAMIAMCIANEPDLLIADEPTTALDVTIQAQVLEVMERIKQRTSSAIALITHDLGVVAGVADRVHVMYAGRIVESGVVDEIFYRPRHPYTEGLLASLPRLDRRSGNDRLHRIKGQPPSLLALPPGCSFNPRCPHARHLLCDGPRPELIPIGVNGQQSACLRVNEIYAAEGWHG